MHHVRGSAAGVAMLATLLAAPGLTAQKKAPAPPPIAVTAQFVAVDDQDAAIAIQPTEHWCQFAGTIASDTGHFTTAAGATCALTFGGDAFAEVSRAELAPQSGAEGSAVSFFVRNVGRANVDGSPIAGQFGLSWRAISGDGVTRTHRLQYGDAFDESIDYAYATCTVAAGATCTQWEVSSTVVLLPPGIPTGEGNLRETGPLARLSVVTGSGAKGVVVLASPLPVPYKLVITRDE